MLARERKPEQTVITNLRIKEALRRQLEREADEHQISLNKEIINRLEDSLEAGAKLELRDIANDMMTNWMRFGKRYLILGLEEDILTAIEDGDLEAARSLVRALRREQEGEARRRAAKTAEKDD
jgi:hypothetical protein